MEGICRHTIWVKGFCTIDMTPSDIDIDAYYDIAELDGCTSQKSKKDFFEAYIGNTILVDSTTNESTGNTIPNTNLLFFQNNNSIQYHAPFSFYFSKYCSDPCCYNEITVASQAGNYKFKSKNTPSDQNEIKYDLPRFGRLQNGIAKDIGADGLFAAFSKGIHSNGFTLNGGVIQNSCKVIIDAIKQNLDCQFSIGGPCRNCIEYSDVRLPISELENPTSDPRFELMKQRYDIVTVLNSENAPNIKQMYLRQKAIDLNQQI